MGCLRFFPLSGEDLATPLRLSYDSVDSRSAVNGLIDSAKAHEQGSEEVLGDAWNGATAAVCRQRGRCRQEGFLEPQQGRIGPDHQDPTGKPPGCAVMLKNLLESTTIEVWREQLFSTPQQYGFLHVYFCIIQHKLASFASAAALTNQPKSWRDIYIRKLYYEIDPLVAHCLHKSRPLIWSEQNFKTTQLKEFYQDSCDFGIRSGLCFPIHGPDGEIGMLNFTSSEAVVKQYVRQDTVLASIALLRDYLFDSYSRLQGVTIRQDRLPKLTPRELECLKWVTAGKSSWEISRILSCAEVTVNYHVTNLMRKLNVRSRRHAVIKALQAGLVGFGAEA